MRTIPTLLAAAVIAVTPVILTVPVAPVAHACGAAPGKCDYDAICANSTDKDTCIANAKAAEEAYLKQEEQHWKECMKLYANYDGAGGPITVCGTDPDPGWF